MRYEVPSEDFELRTDRDCFLQKTEQLIYLGIGDRCLKDYVELLPSGEIELKLKDTRYVF